MIKFPAVPIIEKDGVKGLALSSRYPDKWKEVFDRFEKLGFVKITIEKPDKPATEAQNRAFHALLAEYWQNGLSSYSTMDALRETMKTAYLTQCFKEVEVCGKTVLDIKSWSKFTRKERMASIKCLISECQQAGLNTKKFEEIMLGLNG